jgi:CHASE3 domain sensor protein
MNSGARSAIARINDRARLLYMYKIGAVVVNVLLLFTLVGVTVHASRDLRRQGMWVTHTLEVKNAIRTTALAFMDCESNQRAYLLTGDEVFARSYGLARADVVTIVDRLAVMTKDNDTQRDRIVKLVALMNEKLEYMDSFVVARRTAGRSWTDGSLRHGHDLIVQIRAILVDMDRDENALLEVRSRKMDSTLGRILTGIFVLLGNNVLLVMAIVSGMLSYFEAVRTARRSGTPDPDSIGPLGSHF